MGRHYSGDINGKFMFAVQSSEDANFFGCEGQPRFLSYGFQTDDLPNIEKGLKECVEVLGNNRIRNKLDKFFERKEGFNDEMLMKEFGWTKGRVEYLLEWYARALLGEQIRDSVKKQGHCYFDAEI
jgi:hypothetical protein